MSIPDMASLDASVFENIRSENEVAPKTPSPRESVRSLPTLDQLLSTRPHLRSPHKPREPLIYTTPQKVGYHAVSSAAKPGKSGLRPSLARSAARPTLAPYAAVASPLKASRSTRRTTTYWRSVGMFVEDSEPERRDALGETSSQGSTPPREPPLPLNAPKPPPSQPLLQAIDIPQEGGTDAEADNDADDDYLNRSFGLLTFEPTTPISPVVENQPSSPVSPTSPVVVDDLFSPSPALAHQPRTHDQPISPLGHSARPIELLSSDEEDERITVGRSTPARRLFMAPSLERLDENEGVLFL